MYLFDKIKKIILTDCLINNKIDIVEKIILNNT